MPISKILVGLDGSEASLRAARMAQTIAKATEAKLTLAYVVVPVLPPSGAPWAPLEELMQAEREAGAQILRDAVKALGDPLLHTELWMGAPAEVLTEQAKLEGYSLLVAGSTGKGAVRRVLVGSTCDRLVHISQVPVLIVK